jgi:hypothetical protein
VNHRRVVRKSLWFERGSGDRGRKQSFSAFRSDEEYWVVAQFRPSWWTARRVQTIDGTTTGHIDQNHAAESSIIDRDDHGLADVRYESMHADHMAGLQLDTRESGHMAGLQ